MVKRIYLKNIFRSNVLLLIRYVLLKERNRLLTMEEEYRHQHELFPNPERIDKVEESMRNIMTVIRERDIAYNLLETGKTGEPTPQIRYD